ncbi:hypothetical protein ACF3MZ_17005 [Paenibacillaceae bacterium WGS1546]|uniref:hypothetical protein n=1 Tax=Cohnella sp. WGS1546 TaxID=3366810 RepID=UPI00372CF2EA
MHIPVKDERGYLRMLNVIDEAVYLQVDPYGKLVFHTENEEYSLIRKIEDWASLVSVANCQTEKRPSKSIETDITCVESHLMAAK